jgi:hypothetical protein
MTPPVPKAKLEQFFVGINPRLELLQRHSLGSLRLSHPSPKL